MPAPSPPPFFFSLAHDLNRPHAYNTLLSWDGFEPCDQMRYSLNVHKTILKAIQEQDIERARVAMHEHIYHGRDQVLLHINDSEVEYSGEKRIE